MARTPKELTEEYKKLFPEGVHMPGNELTPEQRALLEEMNLLPLFDERQTSWHPRCSLPRGRNS